MEDSLKNLLAEMEKLDIPELKKSIQELRDSAKELEEASKPAPEPTFPDIEQLGTFEVVSGKIRVTDPCYSKDTWCNGVVENVRNGKWNAIVERTDAGDWGRRVAKLTAVHTDIKDLRTVFDKTDEGFTVGVDSGSAGIFDEDKYPEDRGASVDWITQDDFTDVDGHWGKRTFDANSEEPFYDACGSHTLSYRQAGVLKYGTVSSSGFGDGSYVCRTYRINDEVVGVEIDYGLDELEDEEDSAWTGLADYLGSTGD